MTLALSDTLEQDKDDTSLPPKQDSVTLSTRYAQNMCPPVSGLWTSTLADNHSQKA